jgi:hypothetical protein
VTAGTSVRISSSRLPARGASQVHQQGRSMLSSRQSTSCVASQPLCSVSGLISIPPHAILWPGLAKLLREYSDIKIELNADCALAPLAAGCMTSRSASASRLAKDMTAVRIGPDVRMAVVGAMSYFMVRPPPQEPQDLGGHQCIKFIPRDTLTFTRGG